MTDYRKIAEHLLECKNATLEREQNEVLAAIGDATQSCVDEITYMYMNNPFRECNWVLYGWTISDFLNRYGKTWSAAVKKFQNYNSVHIFTIDKTGRGKSGYIPSRVLIDGDSTWISLSGLAWEDDVLYEYKMYITKDNIVNTKTQVEISGSTESKVNLLTIPLSISGSDITIDASYVESLKNNPQAKVMFNITETREGNATNYMASVLWWADMAALLGEGAGGVYDNLFNCYLLSEGGVFMVLTIAVQGEQIGVQNSQIGTLNK